MISETSKIDRALASKDAESDEAAREEADRAWARMQRGRDCYPYSAMAIQEAVMEADIPTLLLLQEAMEDDDDCQLGRALRRLSWDYWERQAKATRVLRSVP